MIDYNITEKIEKMDTNMFDAVFAVCNAKMPNATLEQVVTKTQKELDELKEAINLPDDTPNKTLAIVEEVVDVIIVSMDLMRVMSASPHHKKHGAVVAAFSVQEKLRQIMTRKFVREEDGTYQTVKLLGDKLIP